MMKGNTYLNLCLLLVFSWGFRLACSGQSLPVEGPFRGQEVHLPDDGELRLIATPADADAYLWSNGWKTPVIFLRDSGWVWVDVTTNGRVRRDSLHVLAAIPCVSFPALYSRTEHQTGFCIRATIRCELEDFELKIYDRWGAMQYMSIREDACWDFRLEGENLPKGSYFYVINYHTPGSDKRTLSGMVRFDF